MQAELENAVLLALQTAEAFRGATAPNPPVGAVGLDERGQILASGAHEKAGTAHAEIQVIEKCRAQGALDRLHTLIVTLEPCHHFGRTPPCTEAILKAPIRRLLYGCPDPNIRLSESSRKGSLFLRSKSIETQSWEELSLPTFLLKRCRELIEPFAYWNQTGMPWITVKQAYSESGSMIPLAGQKTFTSQESLVLAHQLRKQSDAIITGSGTAIADLPEFTVRHVADHPEKKRWLMLFDRRNRIPKEWIKLSESRGFQVLFGDDFYTSFKKLGDLGVIEALVEAGPELSTALLATRYWSKRVVIRQGKPDQIMVSKNLDVYRTH